MGFNLSCYDCIYAEAFRDKLYCRYFPPSVLMSKQSESNIETITIFPTVDKKMWCGQFKELPK